MFISPAGVNGLLKLWGVRAPPPGLVSRDTGKEPEPCVSGPIENAPPCFASSASLLDSADRLVSLVDTPEDPGLESSKCVLDGDALGPALTWS